LTVMTSEKALAFSFWFLGQKLVLHSIADVQSIPLDRLELAGTPDFSSGLLLLEAALKTSMICFRRTLRPIDSFLFTKLPIT